MQMFISDCTRVTKVYRLLLFTSIILYPRATPSSSETRIFHYVSRPVPTQEVR